MTSNSTTEYKIVTDMIVSPDEDIIISITGDLYKDSITEQNRYATIDDITSANTGDITFSGVQMIGAGTAAGDGSGRGTIELVPDGDIVSDQYIVIDPTAPNHIHIRAGGTQDASNANLFLGGERNAVLVSDSGRVVGISVRPSQIVNTYQNINNVSSSNFITTMPAIIQVGATVVIEGSGTYTVVSVTTDDPLPDQVTATITGGVFTPSTNYTFVYEEEYNNQWVFGSDGYLYGPAMGGLFVSGLLNGENDLWLSSNYKVVLNGGTGGAFVADPSNPDNQIATVGDLVYRATAVPTSSIGQLSDVAGLVADDASYHYYCTGSYDGTTHIWKRVAWDAGTWSLP